MTRRVLFILATTAALAGCGVPDDGPLMQPGSDCMSCHSAHAGVASHVWTVAGTLYDDPTSPNAKPMIGAEVLVTDASGASFTLRTNGVGNFYTAETLAFPISVQAQSGSTRMAMTANPPVGSCNACHAAQPLNAAPGRLFVPSN